MLDQMMSALKPMFVKLAGGDQQAETVLARMNELMVEEFRKADFNSMSIELYDKYFTNDEIKDLVRFYESPIGRKAVEVLPQLTQESINRGMQLGQQVAQ